MTVDFYNVLKWLSLKFLAQDVGDLAARNVIFGYDITGRPLTAQASPVLDFSLGNKTRLRPDSLANAYALTFSVLLYHTTSSAQRSGLVLELSPYISLVKEKIGGPQIYGDDNRYMIDDISWQDTTYADVVVPPRGSPYQQASVNFRIETESLPYNFRDPGPEL